jgi:hypothetical protein
VTATDATDAATAPEWTPSAVDLMITLSADRYDNTDQGHTYPVVHWHDASDRHSLDVLGYYEIAIDAWTWSTEFIVGRQGGNRYGGWDTAGHDITFRPQTTYEEAIALAADCLNNLPQRITAYENAVAQRTRTRN